MPKMIPKIIIFAAIALNTLNAEPVINKPKARQARARFVPKPDGLEAKLWKARARPESETQYPSLARARNI